MYKINALPVPSYGPVQRQEYLYYNQQVRRAVSAEPSLTDTMGFGIDRQAERSCSQWVFYRTDACVVSRNFHDREVRLTFVQECNHVAEG